MTMVEKHTETSNSSSKQNCVCVWEREGEIIVFSTRERLKDNEKDIYVHTTYLKYTTYVM